VTRTLVRAVAFALASIVGAVTCGAAAARAAETFYSPEVAGIDSTCNGSRAKAAPSDVIRVARFPSGSGMGPWQLADASAISRVENAPGFTSGEFVTLVLDRGAIVSADLVDDDVSSGKVLAHAWCFIGGKLSRATSDVTLPARADGYRRTRYYGDDVEQPIAEVMLQKGTDSKSYKPPPKELDAVLVTVPYARPTDLPFYDVLAAVRAGTLARLK